MKRRFCSGIAALLLLLSPSLAQADEITGRVAFVKPKQHIIALTNGMTFFVEKVAWVMGLKPGDDVTISFENKDGMLFVLEVSKSDKEA